MFENCQHLLPIKVSLFVAHSLHLLCRDFEHKFVRECMYPIYPPPVPGSGSQQHRRDPLHVRRRGGHLWPQDTLPSGARPGTKPPADMV